MCGIIGYTGKHSARDILISGLYSLEYRGYDSSGIAIALNNEIKIIKAVGKVDRLSEKTKNITFSNIGIGHTRWATHGAPTEVNAHPHRIGKTTIVHNGIIENYIELKKNLEKFYSFKSDTDTEVACAVIDRCYNEEKDHLKALKKAKNILKGSYALAIIFDDDINSIYAIRKDSPLIIAKDNDGSYLASDIAALLKYTNKYYLLEKDEFAKLSNDNLIIYDNAFNIIHKKQMIYKGTSNDVMLNGFKHFMIKEIHDEIKMYKDIIHEYIPNYKITDLIKKWNYLKKYQKITIIGCGSAYHAGMIGKNLLEEYANTETEVIMASEYRYKKIYPKENELVILISQSGETADTLEALRKAKENHLDTLGIINVHSSSIARESDKVIYCLAGCEIAVATTKAYIAQALILSLIAITKAYFEKEINEIDANNYLKELKKLINQTQIILNQKESYKKLAKKIFNNREMFFIGRNIDYALCMEASLKMKEISYIHSEAYPAGELKHGTISLIENNTIVVGIITDKKIASKTISNLKETKARGAYIILLTNKEILKGNITDKFYNQLIIIDNLNIYLQSLTAITIFQLLSYYVALLKGENIDKPKNLAKSVTVE